MEQKDVIISSAYTGTLLPNPPPTSVAITRILCSATPVTSEARNRHMWGFWLVLHRVSSPMEAVQLATAERGSIAFGISRCWRIVSLTMTSAAANAASTSPPSATQWNAWLFGASSCSWGAPGCMAASGLTTTGNGL